MAKRFTLDEIRAMNNRQLNSLNFDETRQVIRTLNDVVTKRMKRLEAAGLNKNSGAYRFLKKKYGDTPNFRMSQFDRSDPKAYARAKDMMYDLVGFVDETRKSATVTGMRNMYQEVRDRIGWKDATDEEVGRVYKTLHELQDKYPAFFGTGGSLGSSEAVTEIVELIKEKKLRDDQAMKVIRWRKGQVDVDELSDFHAWLDANYDKMLGTVGLNDKFRNQKSMREFMDEREIFGDKGMPEGFRFDYDSDDENPFID